MITTAVVVLALIIWAASSSAKRQADRQAEDYVKRVDASKKKRLTYVELANKRHNIHTAKNIIALGLVKPPRHQLERVIQAAYDGVYNENDDYATQTASFFGLIPERANFVGH